MAFTPEQEKALLALLNNKKITLTELPPATEINNDDLLLTRQGIKDKSITSGLLQAHYNKDVLQKSKHLADVANKATARKNLELGTAAQRDVGLGSGNAMEVGAFGIGGTAPLATDDYDMDFFTVTGRNEIFTVTGAWKNGPPIYTQQGGVAIAYHRTYQTGAGRIIHFMALNGPTFTRWHNWYLVSSATSNAQDTEWTHKWVKNLDSENTLSTDIQSIEIGDAQDLNNYVTPGQYYQSLNIRAKAGKNYPVEFAGALLVHRSARIEQIYISYIDHGIYQRSLYNSVWTAWVRFYTTAYNPSAADVGAIAVSTTTFSKDTDFNTAPINSTSFVYGAAQNSPAHSAGSVLDFSGLNGNYSVQLYAGYGNGKTIKFRTRNGDVSRWNPWHELYHSGVHEPGVPVGIPQPWPGAIPPPGWVKCNGWAFDKAKYPKLAVAYPTGVLPDLRGEFIRGWDDGRGGDSRRGLLSWQSDALQHMTGSIRGGCAEEGSVGDGVFRVIQERFQGATGSAQDWGLDFDSARVARSAHETRPRNIAFNYIVRAS